MEMQVRSSIQNLVLAFRADVTDASVKWYRAICGQEDEKEYTEYAFKSVTQHHHVQWYKGKRTDALILGNGAFSAAMKHPEDDTKVIKVWLNGPDGCWTYINKCWQQDEPAEWMPVVHELGMCMGLPYAVMERLHASAYEAQPHIHRLFDVFQEYFGFPPNDIHSGNIMFRRVVGADGVPEETAVLTDPVTEWE